MSTEYECILNDLSMITRGIASTDDKTTTSCITRVERKVTLTLSSQPNGNYAYTWDYPDGNSIFKTPLYTLKLSNELRTQVFEVIRFGPRYVEGNPEHSVAGLADEQIHSLTWYPEYSLHSTDHAENGAWIVFGNFLIHDGPNTDNPNRRDSLIGTAGCLEVFGPKGFSRFNTALRTLGGVGSNKDVNAEITYLKAVRPIIKDNELIVPNY